LAERLLEPTGDDFDRVDRPQATQVALERLLRRGEITWDVRIAGLFHRSGRRQSREGIEGNETPRKTPLRRSPIGLAGGQDGAAERVTAAHAELQVVAFDANAAQ